MKPLAMVVCISKNNCIGKDGKLPWNLPADMKRFRELTTGHPIIMGRKTHESIGRPLPNRLNIVVSKTMGLLGPPGIHVCQSLEIAIGIAEFGRPGILPMVIGGAQLYEAAMPLTTKLYVTTYEKEVEGDTFFPAIKHDHWNVDSQERLGEDLLFTTLSRRAASVFDL